MRRGSRWVWRVALMAAVSAGIAGLAFAATQYWDSNGATAGSGNTGGNWDTGITAKWSASPNGDVATGMWTNGNDAVFSAGTDGTGTISMNVAANTVGNITVEEGTVVLGGTGGTLTLAAAAQWSSSAGTALSVASAVVNGGFLLTVAADAAGPITISGPISGNGGVTKSGAGTLTLSGINTYTGINTVNAAGGTLRATSSPAALGANATATALTLAGGTLELADDNPLNFGRGTTVSGNTTISSDRLTSGSGVTHTLGALSIGAQTLYVTNGVYVTSGTAGLTFGATTLSANGAVFDVATNVNLTLGALAGAYNFTKQNSGRLTFNSASTRASGTLTLAGGTLVLGSTTGLGNAAADALQLNSGTLDLATDSSMTGYNTAVGGDVTIFSDRATLGAGVNPHTLGTLSIGANTLTVTNGPNVISGTAGLTFGTSTLNGNATNNVVNTPGSTTILTLGAVTGAMRTR